MKTNNYQDMPAPERCVNFWHLCVAKSVHDMQPIEGLSPACPECDASILDVRNEYE